MVVTQRTKVQVSCNDLSVTKVYEIGVDVVLYRPLGRGRSSCGTETSRVSVFGCGRDLTPGTAS